ncbi:MAG: regulatory protein RecX [Marinobacter sp.]|uniref:regulatory protein RecX n=1 Tax=Marinobacter sp. TaxID=50741 RepID=UPI00299CD723|nr:regulatory protein RecX [Marinobacter sp.]MDX1634850.1 regulatory protein RecX [Marinobacter sp.]
MTVNERAGQDPEQQARAAALRLLARREHSRQELALKLRQRRIPGDIIERVLDDYEHEGWLSDERFAEVYGRQRRDLGYGPVRIRSELQQRGVQIWPPELAHMTESEWCEMAIRAREKRFGLGRVEDDWPEKARQARFLSQRGFSAEQVERALEASAGDTSD